MPGDVDEHHVGSACGQWLQSSGNYWSFRNAAQLPNRVLYQLGNGFSYSGPSTSRCPFPLAELDVVGTVVSASGPGTKRLIGATVAYDACFAQQINVVLVELVPGTLVTIG